jgi:uncharacterized membrane protein YjgN (DUF898 family)
MNDIHGSAELRDEEPDSAFGFEGTWQEFLPIALTNLLLIVVTLGIYRFWAKARERRYLWSRTRFIDETLEWTGTGLEMFIGFLIVFLILLPLFFGASMAIQALMLRGQQDLAVLLFLGLYGGAFYMIGVAQFRALRYRLTRTWWHGIRGGSEDGGWGYGFSYVWKTLAGALIFGLLIPWSMTSLWNDRWNKMSFGQHRFEAGADTDGLFARWLLIYLVPIVGFVLLAGIFAGLVAAVQDDSAGGPEAFAVLIALGALVFYLLFLLASLSYYAAFYRQVVTATSIGGVDFEFTARTKDWLKLILGNIALVVFTLGLGLIFVGYRNWSFAVRHLEATGEVNLDMLLQSRTAATGDAEGLADAFDIGAI